MPILQLPHRPPARRLRALALLAAVLLHLGALLLVPFPVTPPGGDAVTLLVPTERRELPPPLIAPTLPAESAPVPGAAALASEPAGWDGAGSDRAASARTGDVAPAVAAAIPFLREPAAAPETAAAASAMAEARAATLPLVLRPGGGLGGRRLGRTAEQLAIARAESLLMERLAGIAVVERRDTGAVGLANGGITLAIPWGGFLPADRTDETWRRERCSGSGDGDSDKAGEGEARRARCD